MKMILLTWATVLLTVVLTACQNQRGHDRVPPDPTSRETMSNPVEIVLIAEPTELPISDVSDFVLGIQAKNTTSEALEPNLYTLQLWVNGERSPGFDLAMGNGVQPAHWEVLPASETTSASWPLGGALFPQPGTYTLVLRGQNGDAQLVDLATTTIQVNP